MCTIYIITELFIKAFITFPRFDNVIDYIYPKSSNFAEFLLLKSTKFYLFKV
jgi:hypothetical protein